MNGLRTGEFAPPLNPEDYTPQELQHHCEVVVVEGTPQVVCEVLTDDCPGSRLSDAAGTCLRVPDVRTGDAVVLQGVNFISVNATVRLTAQPPGTLTREVDAHVVGDIETPLTEIVDGVSKVIRDCRVHDRLTFRVPDDLPPGVYALQIVLPNVSGIPELGDPILSNPQFVNVVPPETARFTITSETLTAREETSPATFGSDEVRVRVRAYPVTATLTELLLGEEQAFDSGEFGDMDSGEIRDMTALLFSHQAPIDAMFMSILGFEIDSETAYEEQIDDFTEALYHYGEIVLKAIAAGAGAAALAIGLKDLLLLGLAHRFVVIIAVVVVAVVVTVLSLWAPADPIIVDATTEWCSRPRRRAARPGGRQRELRQRLGAVEHHGDQPGAPIRRPAGPGRAGPAAPGGPCGSSGRASKSGPAAAFPARAAPRWRSRWRPSGARLPRRGGPG